jgi:hypothetical protein
MVARKGSSKKSSPRKTGREVTPAMASLASKAIRKPETLTLKQIRQVGGAALANVEPPTVPAKKSKPAPKK